MEIVQICSNWQYLCVNVLIGIELLKPSRTHVCQYLLLLDVRYKLKYNSLSIFLKSRIQRGAVKCQGGLRLPPPLRPPLSYVLGVNKEVIKYHVSVTAPQLLTWLIFDTFVNFNKYYKMSVSKLERDKLSSVLSKRLLLNWWIDWAQTFRIFFLLIESYLDHCLTFKL